MKRSQWILIVLGVCLTLATRTWYANAAPSGAPFARVSASGTIEADTVRITAQVGGRIESLIVDEGDEIKSGQVVVHLDEALLQTELKKAQAALNTARAQLAQVKAGPRAEDIRKCLDRERYPFIVWRRVDAKHPVDRVKCITQDSRLQDKTALKAGEAFFDWILLSSVCHGGYSTISV